MFDKYNDRIVYKGQVDHNGKAHGFGKATSIEEGRVYEGFWNDNQPITIRFSKKSGYRYYGQWKDFKEHGFGVRTIFVPGSIVKTKYEGQWENGIFHGLGKKSRRNNEGHWNYTYGVWKMCKIE